MNKIVISRGLLQVVYGGIDLDKSHFVSKTFFLYVDIYGNREDISIYDMANDFKEWAFSEGYEIHSFKRADKCYRAYPIKSGRGGSTQEFEGITEPEAMFKACQWVLDNKESL